jgi:hypothetical protein
MPATGRTAPTGRLQLVITLVQEGAAWFDQAGRGAARFTVEVGPPSG